MPEAACMGNVQLPPKKQRAARRMPAPAQRSSLHDAALLLAGMALGASLSAAGKAPSGGTPAGDHGSSLTPVPIPAPLGMAFCIPHSHVSSLRRLAICPHKRVLPGG